MDSIFFRSTQQTSVFEDVLICCAFVKMKQTKPINVFFCIIRQNQMELMYVLPYLISYNIIISTPIQ